MSAKATLGLALALALAAGTATAAELKSGPQPGDSLGAFHVKKVAGAVDDGVKEGSELCYRCKLQDRPVVMIFARTPDAKLAKLLKALDQQVAKHKEEHLSSFVNLIGKDEEKLGDAGKKLAKEAELENVAVVVPVDQPNGPEDYKIDPKADLTVIVYREGKVRNNHAFAKDELEKEHVEKILEESAELLN
jgi:hypothetical protein